MLNCVYRNILFIILIYFFQLPVLPAQLPSQEKIVKNHIASATSVTETYYLYTYSSEDSYELHKKPVSISTTNYWFNDTGWCYKYREIEKSEETIIWISNVTHDYDFRQKIETTITIDSSFSKIYSQKDNAEINTCSVIIETEITTPFYWVNRYVDHRNNNSENYSYGDSLIYDNDNKPQRCYHFTDGAWTQCGEYKYDAEGREIRMERRTQYPEYIETNITEKSYLPDGNIEVTEKSFCSTDSAATMNCSKKLYNAQNEMISQYNSGGKNVSFCGNIHDTVYYENNGTKRIEKTTDEKGKLSDITVAETLNGKIYAVKKLHPGYQYEEYYYTYAYGIDSTLLSEEISCFSSYKTEHYLNFMKWKAPAAKGNVIERKKFDLYGNMIEDKEFDMEGNIKETSTYSYTYAK